MNSCCLFSISDLRGFKCVFIFSNFFIIKILVSHLSLKDHLAPDTEYHDLNILHHVLVQIQ
jgi:hypothetical protein